MSDSFSQFLLCTWRNPVLGLTALLLLAVMLVNGWTDAPNAIAAAVTTGALSFRRAAGLAALCNLTGTLVTVRLCPGVAQTLYSLTGFRAGGRQALSALCAGLCAVVLWAVLAWSLGIPTSESHALVAGVAGAALALPGGAAQLDPSACGRVLLGLILSLALGYLSGAGFSRLLAGRPGSFRRGQIAGAAAAAFFHGAQDGQKFIGVFLLGCSLAENRGDSGFLIPPWLGILCALVMSLGTLIGGRRIVETVGHSVSGLSPAAGFSADLGGGCTLLLCTLAGLPVSTTHAKTAAFLGAGQAAGGRSQPSVVRTMLAAWTFTFPCCGFLGFLLARVFLFFPR